VGLEVSGVFPLIHLFVHVCQYSANFLRHLILPPDPQVRVRDRHLAWYTVHTPVSLRLIAWCLLSLQHTTHTALNLQMLTLLQVHPGRPGDALRDHPRGQLLRYQAIAVSTTTLSEAFRLVPATGVLLPHLRNVQSRIAQS
jgi:hypothetical protein